MAAALFDQVGYGATGLVDGGAAGEYQTSTYSTTTTTNAAAPAYLANSLVTGVGYGAGAGYGAGYGVGYGAGYDTSYGTGYGSGYGAVGLSSSDAAYSSAANYASLGAAQTYATDAQGLFLDSNPQIVRRAAQGGPQTYTQNIQVRFLQPPPVPPPGPLIIREVRPPQPPAPLPLRIRQQAPPLPTPPPLVLREQPPLPPATVASQTVIRRLPGLPVPPRSTIIERFPAPPPRPRDIIIERWVPYGAQAKRQTIVQRAGPALQYAAPRNIIYQYDTPQVSVARQFQRLGVTAASPQAYAQQYGASLLDAGTLVQQARAAGVIEDISPPAPTVSASYGFGYGAGYGTSYGAGYGAGYGTSYGADYSTGYGAGYGFGAAEDAFVAADTNLDGVLSQGEFSNFIAGAGIGGSSFQSSSYSI